MGGKFWLSTPRLNAARIARQHCRPDRNAGARPTALVHRRIERHVERRLRGNQPEFRRRDRILQQRAQDPADLLDQRVTARSARQHMNLARRSVISTFHGSTSERCTFAPGSFDITPHRCRAIATASCHSRRTWLSIRSAIDRAGAFSRPCGISSRGNAMSGGETVSTTGVAATAGNAMPGRGWTSEQRYREHREQGAGNRAQQAPADRPAGPRSPRPAAPRMETARCRDRRPRLRLGASKAHGWRVRPFRTNPDRPWWLVDFINARKDSTSPR